MNSHIDGFEFPLEGETYDGVDANLVVEVRDFSEKERTLVITTVIEDSPIVTLVSWSTFVDHFDAMRSRMMSSDWDEALSQLVGRSA